MVRSHRGSSDPRQCTVLHNLDDYRWYVVAAVALTIPRPLFLRGEQLLTALQVLSRGSFFDDIRQLALISERGAQAGFHKFGGHFAADLYEEHIGIPTGETLKKVLDDYDRLGFTGAVGSTDVTHIRWS